MDFDDETKELNDDVLEGLDESTEDDEEENPLANLSSNEPSEEDEENEEDEDDIDDAKLFGGVDDEDEGYNPFEDNDMEEWS